MELVLGIIGFAILFPLFVMGVMWWCEVCYKFFFSERE